MYRHVITRWAYLVSTLLVVACATSSQTPQSEPSLLQPFPPAIRPLETKFFPRLRPVRSFSRTFEQGWTSSDQGEKTQAVGHGSIEATPGGSLLWSVIVDEITISSENGKRSKKKRYRGSRPLAKVKMITSTYGEVLSVQTDFAETEFEGVSQDAKEKITENFDNPLLRIGKFKIGPVGTGDALYEYEEDDLHRLINLISPDLEKECECKFNAINIDFANTIAGQKFEGSRENIIVLINAKISGDFKKKDKSALFNGDGVGFAKIDRQTGLALYTQFNWSIEARLGDKVARTTAYMVDSLNFTERAPEGALSRETQEPRHDLENRLAEVKRLLEKGLISQEEAAEIRRKLLEELREKGR